MADRRIEGTKECRRCRETKPVIDFGSRKQASDGLHSYCRQCVNSISKSYREKNGDRYRETQKKYYWTNRESILAKNNTPEGKAKRLAQFLSLCERDPTARERMREANKRWQAKNGRAKHLWDRYKMTTEDYDSMLERQGNRCASCRREFVGEWSNPILINVDHVHDETNRVRGILCWKCNIGVAHLGDTLDGVMQMETYLVHDALDLVKLARGEGVQEFVNGFV